MSISPSDNELTFNRYHKIGDTYRAEFLLDDGTNVAFTLKQLQERYASLIKYGGARDKTRDALRKWPEGNSP